MTTEYEKSSEKTTSEFGRNKRTVWNVNTKPFKEAHFAVFPEALVETPILAGCPEFVCKKCGNAREKMIKKRIVYESEKNEKSKSKKIIQHSKNMKFGKSSMLNIKGGGKAISYNYTNSSYTDCGCNTGFDSGIVLDMFMGAGTTAITALKNNRKYIGIELNKEYIKIAESRILKYIESS